MPATLPQSAAPTTVQGGGTSAEQPPTAFAKASIGRVRVGGIAVRPKDEGEDEVTCCGRGGTNRLLNELVNERTDGRMDRWTRMRTDDG